ncbi:hypothetical protein ACO1O0_000385 [Amphichorda felina]
MKFINTAAILLASLVGNTIAAPVSHGSSLENNQHPRDVEALQDLDPHSNAEADAGKEIAAKVLAGLADGELGENLSDIIQDAITGATQKAGAGGNRGGNQPDIDLARILKAVEGLIGKCDPGKPAVGGSLPETPREKLGGDAPDIDIAGLIQSIQGLASQCPPSKRGLTGNLSDIEMNRLAQAGPRQP